MRWCYLSWQQSGKKYSQWLGWWAIRGNVASHPGWRKGERLVCWLLLISCLPWGKLRQPEVLGGQMILRRKAEVLGARWYSGGGAVHRESHLSTEGWERLWKPRRPTKWASQGPRWGSLSEEVTFPLETWELKWMNGRKCYTSWGERKCRGPEARDRWAYLGNWKRVGAHKFHSTDPYARSTIYELCDPGKFLNLSELLFSRKMEIILVLISQRDCRIKLRCIRHLST